MAPVVELADVSIVRNGSTLLDRITWVIDEADRWVVIGPNGAGKTTLLQVVSAAYAVVGRWHEGYEVDDFRRAAQLMQQLHIEHLGKRTFGTLSEGERKRVQIARALMTDPELLLLDEPGAGLDLAGRERLVATLSEIVADEFSPATVLVTHHLEEIPPGMTHAMLLKQGRVVASGPITEVLTDEHMSEAFDLPLKVSVEDGRWSARAARRHPERAAVEE